MAGLNDLLDSNILSEPTRRHPDGEVRSRLQAYRHGICTAAPILHELRYGVAQMSDGARKRQLLLKKRSLVQKLLTGG